MNKTLLVAQREFAENMRTKTFWLGILSFPILIAIAIFVGKLFEQSKDVRRYAILDHSEGQWLSRAVLDRSLTEDLAKFEPGEDSATSEERKERFREWIESLDEDHPIRQLREALVSAGIDESAMNRPDGTLPPEALPIILSWASDPAHAKALEKLGRDLALLDYRLVEYDDLGGDPERELRRRVKDGELFAFFVIDADPLDLDSRSRYVSNNKSDDDLRKWFSRHATEVVRAERIERLDLTDREVASIEAGFRFAEQEQVNDSGESETVTKEDKLGAHAPIAFVYLLWIAVFTAANMLLTNTIEEKSNRLIEVLLSSVSPLQLMAGKVIGIGATGLTIVASWVVSAMIGVQFAPQGLGVDLGAIVGNPLYLGSFVAYFLAGYLLYAAVLVAIGSVCNSLKEAQSLMQPVFILLMVPLIAMVPVVQDPNGTMAKVLTYIPLFTPFLMMNRAAAPPPAWEYAASSIVILVALVIAFWGAAKIFRIGILMTGKPPKIREILGWLRAPVGIVGSPARDSSTR
ncbi:MAG: ABC transporter permease [Planctomycetes bacterium]|nr:ABC transporter permease [Planctomycetota bacterium]